MTEVIMPKMGDAMEEGTLLEWLKKEGESVKSGEIIGTIQTDKATLELEAPGTGTLGGVLIAAGETVPVGKAIAVILKTGEEVPANWGSGKAASKAPAEAKSEPQKAEASAAPTIVSTNDRVKASPLAKKIAAERGVDISALVGTGPGGRIVEKDVPVAAPQTAQPIAAAQGDQKVGLTRLRQITAQRTAQSMREAPHFYVTVEVDLEAIQSVRDFFEAQEAGKISVNDFIVRACAQALREMPVVNSTFAEDGIVQHGDVHMGIAASVADGLTVAVLRHADQLTLRQIAAATKDLVSRARENKLKMDELSGSTFSISNMGMLNVDQFTAIINQPNAAILAVATAKKKAIVNDEDEIEARLMMNITGGFDHRVVDGSVGAQFMNLVRDLLENPAKLLS